MKNKSILSLAIIVFGTAFIGIVVIALLDHDASKDSALAKHKGNTITMADTDNGINKEHTNSNSKESPSSNNNTLPAQTFELFAEVADPDGWTNVRSQPTANSRILLRLNNGKAIKVNVVWSNGKQTNWYYVPKYKGYVYKTKIRIVR